MKHEESDAERIIRVEGDIASLKGSVSSIQGTLSIMNDRLSAIGRPNYVLWVSAMGVALTVFTLATGGLFYFMKSEVTSQVSPLAIKATNSETDRHAINDRMGRIADSLAEVETRQSNQEAALKEQLREIETQFRAISQIQNVRTSYNQQMFGLLWRKTYSEDLPTIQYFSDMSQPKAHGN